MVTYYGRGGSTCGSTAMHRRITSHTRVVGGARISQGWLRLPGTHRMVFGDGFVILDVGRSRKVFLSRNAISNSNAQVPMSCSRSSRASSARVPMSSSMSNRAGSLESSTDGKRSFKSREGVSIG